jgi:photosystem II stability/assembly factor-like uncharacterized protein
MDVSTDGASTIYPANTGLTNPNSHALAIDPAEPTTLYLGNDAGLSRSTDGAATWTSASGVLPAPGPRDPVFAILIDPASHRTVYAATSSALYKSRDGGMNWFTVGSGIPSSANVLSLVADPSVPDTIYAGTTGGVYKTTNGGGSWSSVRSGMTGSSVFALLLDPGRRILYAGTEAGVFRSEDGGASWTLAGNGLVNPRVNTLAMDAQGTPYAGTDGAGVFFLLPALEDRAPLSPPPSRRPRPPVLPRSGP